MPGSQPDPLVVLLVHPHVAPAAGRSHEEPGRPAREQLRPDEVCVELLFWGLEGADLQGDGFAGCAGQRGETLDGTA